MPPAPVLSSSNTRDHEHHGNRPPRRVRHGPHRAPPALLIALLTASSVAVLPLVGLMVPALNGWALARWWHHVGWHLLSATCLDINVVVTVAAAPAWL